MDSTALVNLIFQYARGLACDIWGYWRQRISCITILSFSAVCEDTEYLHNNL